MKSKFSSLSPLLVLLSISTSAPAYADLTDGERALIEEIIHEDADFMTAIRRSKVSNPLKEKLAYNLLQQVKPHELYDQENHHQVIQVIDSISKSELNKIKEIAESNLEYNATNRFLSLPSEIHLNILASVPDSERHLTLDSYSCVSQQTHLLENHLTLIQDLENVSDWNLDKKTLLKIFKHPRSSRGWKQAESQLLETVFHDKEVQQAFLYQTQNSQDPDRQYRALSVVGKLLDPLWRAQLEPSTRIEIENVLRQSQSHQNPFIRSLSLRHNKFLHHRLNDQELLQGWAEVLNSLPALPQDSDYQFEWRQILSLNRLRISDVPAIRKAFVRQAKHNPDPKIRTEVISAIQEAGESGLTSRHVRRKLYSKLLEMKSDSDPEVARTVNRALLKLKRLLPS